MLKLSETFSFVYSCVISFPISNINRIPANLRHFSSNLNRFKEFSTNKTIKKLN